MFRVGTKSEYCANVVRIFEKDRLNFGTFYLNAKAELSLSSDADSLF